MQLLQQADVSDFDAWRAAFDGQGEAYRDAGLSLLQMWRDADHEARVFLLFEVSDAERARAFLAGPRLAQQNRSAGVVGGAHHFVRTA